MDLGAKPPAIKKRKRERKKKKPSATSQLQGPKNLTWAVSSLKIAWVELNLQ
jgi:hypothetical protein